MASSGSALAENEKWLDSIEGKTYQFTNALQTMWSNILDSEAIKGFIDFGTDAIQFLDTAHGKIIAIVSAAALMAKFKGFSLKGLKTSLVDSIRQIAAAQQTLQTLGQTTKIGQGYDPTIIQAYAQAVSNLTAKQQANLLAAQGLNQEQIKSILIQNKVEEGAIKEAMAQGRASWAKSEAAASESFLNQVKNMTIVTSLRSMAQTASEADKVKLLAVANEIAERSSEELTEAKLKELMVTQQLGNEVQEEAMKKINSAVSGVSGVVKQAGASLSILGGGLKALFATNPVGAILTIVSAAFTLISVGKSIYDHFHKSAEEITQAAKEAEDSIKSLTSEFKQDAKTVSDYAERFAELAQGVDMLSGKNISLTTDDYEEFLDLSNQLADIFPTLSRNYDENGNAIIQLSGDTDTMVGSLQALLDVQRQLTNQKIAENLPDLYKGVKQQSDDYVDKLNELESKRDAYDRQLKEIVKDGFIEDFNNLLDVGQISIIGIDDAQALSEMDEIYTSILKELGLEYEYLSSEYDRAGNITGHNYRILDFVNGTMTEEEIEAAKSKIVMAINELAGTYSTEINNLNNQIQTTVNENKANWSSLLSSIASWLSTDSSYRILDDEMKSVVQTVINNMDFSSLKFSSWEQLQEYIQNNILSIFTDKNLGKIVAKSIKGMFDLQSQLQSDDITINKYKEKFLEFIDTLNSQEIDPSVLDQIKQMFNLDLEDPESIGKDIDSLIKHAQELVTKELQDQIYTLNYSDLQLLYQVKADTIPAITSMEALKQKIKEVKTAMIEDFTVSNFTDYTDSISTLQENISVYQEALEKLESGSFTFTDFVELIEQFPDLAKGVDTSSKSFNGLSKNLKKAIRNSPDDLVDELKDLREQLKEAGKSTTDIDNLINAMENMPIDTVKSLSDEYITLADAINDAKIAQNELKDAMSENPNEGFETRAEAMEYMKEALSRGEIGSESNVWNVAEQYGFTYDSAKSINENADALANFITVRNKWYAKDGDGNYSYEGTENFINAMEQAVAKSSELQKYMSWSYEDGVLSFDFDNENWDKIIEYLSQTDELAGLTSEEFYDLLMQVGQFHNINWQDADDLIWFLNQMREGSKSISENFDSAKNAVQSFLESSDVSLDWLDRDINIVNTDEFKKLPEEIQKVLEQYYDLKAKFEADPLGIKFQLDKDSSNKVTKESLEALSQLTTILQDNGTGTVFIDYTHLKEAAKEAGYTEEAINDIIEKIKEYNNVCGIERTADDPLGLIGLQEDAKMTEQYLTALQIKFESIQNADNTVSFKVETESLIDTLISQGWTAEGIQSYLTTLENSGTYSFTIDGAEVELSTEDAQSKINQLIEDKQAMSNGETTQYTVTGPGEASVDHIKAVWDRIPRTKSTRYSVYENTYKSTKKYNPITGTYEYTAGVNGTAHVQGTVLATGSWGTPKTETALVGELGPEIIVDPKSGKWHTVGDTGAEFTQVEKGSIIFNHKQTEQLLKNGYVAGRGKAYASGTAYVSTSNSTHKKYNFDDTSGSERKGSSSSSSADDAKDQFEELFDWIEVRLEEINKQLDFKNARLDNSVGFAKQNAVINEMLDLNEKLYDNLIAGANKYYEYANKLLAKIPSEYRKAAQDGSIAIEEFAGEADEKTLEAIKDFREWIQKADDAVQQAEEVLTEISSLAKQAIDNIATDFGNKNSIRDNVIDQLDAYNALAETKYGNESEAIYQDIIKNTNENIKALQTQRDEMQAELNKQVEAGNIKKYSQDWYDAVNDIAAVDTEIINLTTDTYDYQDSINELHWDHFDNLLSRLEAISDEADNLIDILGSKDLVDKDTGKWTDEGIASLGLYAQKMEVAEMQAQKYADEIDYLNENWEELGYTEQEYLEKLAELKEGQYDAIKSYNDSKDAIVDLNKARIDAIKDGIQKEIDAYSELIKKKKEELDAEKDLHDFQKGVMEQQKDIADLERQLAALSADNSASARAKRAKLEAELAEARADLEETYYDRSISNQQDALDKELENFQESKDKEMEGWDEYLENTEQVVADSLSTVQANTDTVYQTLKVMGEEYSLSIAESLTSPWKDGENAIQSYSEKFGLAMSSTVEELKELEAEYKEFMNEIENSGEKFANQVDDNAKSYTEAEYKEPAKKEEQENEKPKDEEKKPSLTKGSYVELKPGTRWYADSYGGGASGKAKSGKIKYINEKGSHPYNIDGAGWVRKKDIKGYKLGTTNIGKSDLYNLDELGEELIIRAHNGRITYLEKGSGVVPADVTSNLMQWGRLDPTIMLDQNRPSIGVHPEIHNTEIKIDNSIAELIHIDKCETGTLPDVKKIVDEALEKHTQRLNNSLRKYAR